MVVSIPRGIERQTDQASAASGGARTRGDAAEAVRAVAIPRGLVAIFAALTLSLTLSGCGNFFDPKITTTTTTTTTNTGDSLYIANTNASLDTIAGFDLSTSGTLSATGSSPYQLGVTPSAMAMSPSNSLLYVSSVVGSAIYAYSVAANGTLTLINNAPILTGIAAESIAIDPSGNYLLAAQTVSGGGPLLSVFQINTSTGKLTEAGSLSLDAGTTAEPSTAGQLYFVPGSTTGTHLLYAALGVGGVDVLSFNSSSGALTKFSISLNPLGTAYSDNGLASDPSGKYLFVSETGANAIRSFTINSSTGALTSLSTPTTAVGSGAGAMLVDATGKFLYVANFYSDTISAFTLDSTGALTAVSGSPFSTGSGPISMAEDSSKGYLAVVCSGGTPDLDLFPINATTGVLGTAVTQSTGSTTPADAVAVVATYPAS